MGRWGPDLRDVVRFVEEPDLATATAYVAGGRHRWNGGMFFVRASRLLAELERSMPTTAAGLATIAAALCLGGEAAAARATAAVYPDLPAISIDHGVLESAGTEGRVITLEADFAWSDIGSWVAVHRMMQRDRDGNAGRGNWLAFDSQNCLAHAGDRLVVLLGIQDIFVVDTSDALLVGDLKRSQEVRELVAELKKRGYGNYTVK